MALRQYSGLEIIVVDGGSIDKSVKLAKSHGVQVISSAPGRGLQLNTGAIASTGEILLFLHCDTSLPPDFITSIQKAFNDPKIIGGGFRLKIKADNFGFRLIEWGIEKRSKFFHLIYGDQAIFVKRNIFFRVGGFPEQPLLEDVLLVRNLKSLGKLHLSKKYVNTSARRWKRLGIIQTTLINQVILLGYLLKVNPKHLAKLYYRKTWKKVE